MTSNEYKILKVDKFLHQQYGNIIRISAYPLKNGMDYSPKPNDMECFYVPYDLGTYNNFSKMSEESKIWHPDFTEFIIESGPSLYKVSYVSTKRPSLTPNKTSKGNTRRTGSTTPKKQEDELSCTGCLLILLVPVLIVCAVIGVNYYNAKNEAQQLLTTQLDENDILQQAETLEKIKEYKEKYLWKLFDVIEEEKLNQKEEDIFNQFSFDTASKISSGYLSEHAKSIRDKFAAQYVNEMLKLAESTNTMSAYESFFTSIKDIKDCPEKKEVTEKAYELMENLKWSDEDIAWECTKKTNYSEDYEEFMEHFPNSAHKNECVAAFMSCIRDEDPEAMPILQHNGGKIAETSIIEVTNSSEIPLVVAYNGPNCLLKVLNPGQTLTQSVKSGMYEISAKVKNPENSSIRSYYGKSRLVGGIYKSNLVIKFSR